MEPRLPPGFFYGEKVKNCNEGGLLLADHRYPPFLELPKHSHERAYFCLVLRGTYTESYGMQTRICKPLSLVFHPQGEVHSDQFHDTGGRIFGIEVSHSLQARVRDYSPFLANPAEMQGGMAAWIALRLYHEFQQMDSLSPLAIEGLALELMVEAARCAVGLRDTTTPRWLRQAQKQLNDQYADPPSLEDIANAAGVHPVHLIRAFRQHYRTTIGNYVRQLRVDFAAEQLAASETSLAEIALDAGFSDQSQFTRSFKQITGLTPAQFRRTARSR